MSNAVTIKHAVVRLGISATVRRADRRIIEGREHRFCADCDGWVEVSNFYGGVRRSGYCKPHTIARNTATASKRAKRQAVEPSPELGRALEHLLPEPDAGADYDETGSEGGEA